MPLRERVRVERDQPWSENMIARALAMDFFERKHLVLVPNCNWTGRECDLLIVTRDLRIIDVEIKISRADFRADAAKEKWWHYGLGTWSGESPNSKWIYPKKERKPWPPKIWKHYYALPAALWKSEMREQMGSPMSGVLLLSQAHGKLQVSPVKQAKPNRAAERIDASDAIDIARLASLRMRAALAKQRN